MQKKYLAYAFVPAFAIAIVSGRAASAHGMFGFGKSNLTSDQTATSQSMFQHHADILGISIEEVKNAWADGKSMHDLAVEKGIADEQLRTKMQETRKTEMKKNLQTLVQKGVITQAQADKRAQVIDKMTASNAEGKGLGRGMGGHHGMGGMHNGF